MSGIQRDRGARSRFRIVANSAVIAALLGAIGGRAAGGELSIPLPPNAVVDLQTPEGAALVGAEWRYADARVIGVDHRAPGPDLKPSGAPNRTHDIEPKAGASGFDDSRWEVVAADQLTGRRSSGKLSFGWYRVRVTLPPQVGEFSTYGSTVVFEVVVDDYAEVWIDGRLTPVLGQSGGQVARGWNAPDRVVVRRDARPGDEIQLAVFAANAPLSAPPENYVWIRSATLDFFAAGRLEAGRDAPVEEALDGLEVDVLGNVYASGPGGVWIVSPSGVHLGTIVGPELPANFAWGGEDSRTLYMTARSGLYRMRLGVAGTRTRFRPAG